MFPSPRSLIPNPRSPIMEQPIIGFRLDDVGDWVAVLACGHGQHVRHDPPLSFRPWVLAPQGRDEKIGWLLNCVRCDQGEPPTFDV